MTGLHPIWRRWIKKLAMASHGFVMLPGLSFCKLLDCHLVSWLQLALQPALYPAVLRSRRSRPRSPGPARPRSPNRPAQDMPTMGFRDQLVMYTDLAAW